MSSSSPKAWRMFLPLGIVLILALLWSGYWLIALNIAKTRLAELRANLAASGLTVSCTQESWGGYPFHLELGCQSPVITYRGQAELKSGHLLLVALAYAPWQVAALLDGPTTVSAPQLPMTTLAHERALAAITFDGEKEPSFSADVPALSIPGLGEAEQIMLHSRPSSQTGTDVALSVKKLVYRGTDKPPVTLDTGSVLGTLLPDQSFTVQKLDLQQGELRVWGSGTISLDQSHRVNGKLETETNDVNALLAVLAPHLALSDNQMANLKMMLGLLGSAAKAPLIAKDGVLYLGPFKIADLTPLY